MSFRSNKKRPLQNAGVLVNGLIEEEFRKHQNLRNTDQPQSHQPNFSFVLKRDALHQKRQFYRVKRLNLTTLPSYFLPPITTGFPYDTRLANSPFRG